MAILRAQVSARFLLANILYEGAAFWLYTDIENLCTTGIGNLVDPVERSLKVPWKRDGRAATEKEVRWEFDLIKNGGYAKPGWQVTKGVTELRLDKADVEKLVLDRLNANAAYLVKRFPKLPEWPAPAQMALMLWAWAGGPGQQWPKLFAFLDAQDFAGASTEISYNEAGNPGLAPRNKTMVALMQRASEVMANGSDPEEVGDVPMGKLPEPPPPGKWTKPLPSEATDNTGSQPGSDDSEDGDSDSDDSDDSGDGEAPTAKPKKKSGGFLAWILAFLAAGYFLNRK